MTNAGLTAALAPVREELGAIELEAQATIREEEAASEATWDARSHANAEGAFGAVKRIRSAIDRIHPEPDVLAALGMAALGMLKELREQHEIEGESCKERVVDFCKRADELLAAAYPNKPPT